jgi:hypothetical protein
MSAPRHRLKCAIRGCKEHAPSHLARLDRFICKPHFDLADEPIKQAWINARSENTNDNSTDSPREVSEYRFAWSNLLKSAHYNSLKQPRAAKAAKQAVVGPRARRKADREAAMNAARRKAAGVKATRKRGPVALEDDTRRFEIPLFILFNERCRLPKDDAAFLTMLLIGPLAITHLFDVEGAVVLVEAEKFKSTYSEDRYAERIARKTQEVVERNVPKETGWLAHSVMALAFMMKHHLLRDLPVMAVCFDELRQHGWEEPIREVIRRAEALRKSNYQPFVGPLSQAVAALVDGLQYRNPVK